MLSPMLVAYSVLYDACYLYSGCNEAALLMEVKFKGLIQNP